MKLSSPALGRVRAGVVDLSQHIQDVQQRNRAVEIVYQSHARWPLVTRSYSTDVGDSPANAGPSITSSKAGLRIAILDSSFNPPTLAHLALARSARHSHDDDHPPCDARLLLLSVRNADKALKAGDASYEQRLEMMMLLAEELEDQSSSPGKQESGNVAVAIIDEPTFVRKSAVLHQFLQDRVAFLKLDSSEQVDTVLSSPRPTSSPTLEPQIKLDFLMGFDTLERFLAPRYYGESSDAMHAALRRFFAPPPEGDGSSVVCAWRGERSPEFAYFRSNSSSTGAVEIEKEKAQSSRTELPTKMSETLSLARPFIKSGCISFAELTDREMSLSSSEVRDKRADGDTAWMNMVPATVGEFIERAYLYVQ